MSSQRVEMAVTGFQTSSLNAKMAARSSNIGAEMLRLEMLGELVCAP